MNVDSIDPAFGHWFAGFVDGEGSFRISQPRNSFVCGFSMALRRDDRAILEECRQMFGGLGRIHLLPPRTSRSPNANPEIRWEIGDKKACAELVQFFDRFPLRAKKARDFTIWREAVLEWNRIGHGKGTRVTDWSRMAALKAELQRIRRYSDELAGPEIPEVIHLPQLELAA